MYSILHIILYIWQLPQNLVGLILILWEVVVRDRVFRREEYNGTLYLYLIGFPGAISLGQFVLLNINYLEDEWTKAHEFGHAKQSMILGPLYLFVIGIPSLVHAAFFFDYKNIKKYYEFYTERWADKLGRVVR